MLILYILIILLLLHYSLFLCKIIFGLNKLKKIFYNGIREEFISIVIPFRNEAENICRNLHSLKNIDYPGDKYEIIYVDDYSTDDSVKLLLSEEKRCNVKILTLPVEVISTGNKKRALEYGIKNSSGEIIVTTDADCVHHKNWLRSLMKDFDANTAFISGPLELMKNSSLFYKIQELEFEGLVLTGAGLIGSGTPVICNGANIAYRKSIFEEVYGFDDNIQIASGDDELLMQKISLRKKGSVKFCWDDEAIVRANSCKNMKEFLNQRTRWASKSFYYTDKFLVLRLVLIFLFYTGLVIQPVLILLGYQGIWVTFILSAFIKVYLEFRIIEKGRTIFSGGNNIFIFLLTELLQVLYIIISAFLGLFGNFEWKDRKIKR